MHRTSMVLCLGLLVCLGCASEQSIRSHERGSLSQLVAERSYKSIYQGYKAGVVNEELLRQTEEAYEAWTVQQRLLLNAYQAGVPDSPELTAGVRQSLRELLRLAADAGVL